MSLTLSSQDVVRLREAIRALSSPLDYEDVDEWRRAANGAVRTLVGADKALFKLPSALEERAAVAFSDEHEDGLYTAYQPYYAKRDLGLRRTLTGRLEVFCRDQLFPDDRRRLLRSECYNDFLLPHGIGDSLGMLEKPGDLDGAGLWLHHSKPQGLKFSDRGMSLLQLLAPAFRAGVAIRTRLARTREGLAAMLDRMEHGLAVFDLQGRRLHYNRWLRDVLERTADERLERRIRRSARRAGRIIVDGGAFERDLEKMGDAEGGGETAYEVRAVPVGEVLGVPGGGVLVGVRPARRAPAASPRQLRERFGLTPREAEVALLLAERKTNREIADELVISPHTARRHTERVLGKLGIHSRRSVGDKVREAARGDGTH